MASKKPSFPSKSNFALHAAKRALYVWLIVGAVVIGVYWNGGLAHFLADKVTGHPGEKESWFFHNLLTVVFFLLVPGSLVIGACWAEEDDRPEKEPTKKAKSEIDGGV